MRRGLTLLEVLLAGTLLLFLTGVVLASFKLGWGARRTMDAATDAYRACMVAQSHLRSELRGVHVLSPANSNGIGTLIYRRAQLVNGNLKVDASGEPIWEAQVSVWVDARGNLVSQQVGKPQRVLARLGTGGSISFRCLDQYLLEILIHTERRDRDRPDTLIPYEVKDTVYLPNQ